MTSSPVAAHHTRCALERRDSQGVNARLARDSRGARERGGAILLLAITYPVNPLWRIRYSCPRGSEKSKWKSAPFGAGGSERPSCFAKYASRM